MTTNNPAVPLYVIKGARQLSTTEIDLMNRIKDVGEQVRSIIDAVRILHYNEFANFDAATATNDEKMEHSRLCSEGQRHRGIATDDLQGGLMHLVRAVARPSSFA